MTGRIRKRLELTCFIAREEGISFVRRLPWRKSAHPAPQIPRKTVPSISREERTVGPVKRPPGINLVGYFTGNFGTATSARAFSHAIRLTGVPFNLCNLVAEQYARQEFNAHFSDGNPYSVNLLHLNPDSLEAVLRSKGDAMLRGRYNVGIWYWESEKFPERWRSALPLVDEIWVTSSFTQKTIQAVSPVPVARMTYPLNIDTSIIERGTRKSLSVEEDEFLFLFAFNFASCFERKNPLALLRALKLAFPDREKVKLVIYCLNQKIDYPNALLLKNRCAALPVKLIKTSLSWPEYLSLLAAADCYISLHRAEGLGIPLAESMYLGKPVIATRYSGNLEFMTDSDSLLVDYQLVGLTRNIGPFEKGTVWAEPDVKHAAQLMRWVYSNREEAKELGLRASTHVRSALDPTITAKEIQERLRPQLIRDSAAS